MYINKKCLTFVWKIKNINLSVGEISTIVSPCFLAHEMEGTKWHLCLRPNSSGFKSCVACGIVAEHSAECSKQFEFDFEISILGSDGSVQHSELFLKQLYKEGYNDWSSALYIKSDEVFLPKTGMHIPDDSLTIRCRMWDCQNLISLSGRCFAETLLQGKSEYLEGRIEHFSHLEPSEKFQLFNCYSLSTLFNLCIAPDGNIAIEMKRDNPILCMYKYKIFVRDIFGNKVKCGQGEIIDSKQHCAPLTFSKEHLMRNQRYFLPDDILTIDFEVFFRIDEADFRYSPPIKEIVKTEYGFEYPDTPSFISDTKNPVVLAEKQYIENLLTLKDDLTSLFKEGILCDTKLKTATETFPAHSVVLSARSPVFKSMFSIDMKEKTNSCVDINDLDADTVRRMLVFMYSGNLDDLEYESAKSLYFAADKYSIVSLFQTCSNFLRKNLLHSNCCDILLLADIHQDKDLKTAVQDFMGENYEAVLSSDEWKNLEKNNPQLTIEALRTVCIRKR